MKDVDAPPAPREWLLSLEQTPGAYLDLVRSSGIFVAAFMVAEARLLASSCRFPPPTMAEVYAAALDLCRFTGGDSPPTARALASVCNAHGLTVID